MPSRLAAGIEITRLIKAMAYNGRGIFMLTKSNNTTIKDIETIMGETKRPAMIAAILHNPVKKDWAYDTLNDIKKSSNNGYEFWGQVSCRPLSMEFTMREPYMFEGLSSWKIYMTENDYEKKKKILSDKNFRKNVQREINDVSKNKLFVGNWKKIKLIQACNKNNKKYEGLNLEEISIKEKKTPFDWLMDNTSLDSGDKDLFIAELLNSDESYVKKLLCHHYSTVSLSDAGAHLSLLCDSGYGLDLLGKWTRDLRVLTLENTIYKLTGKQAEICRILKRGKLLPGYYADMLLFDPHTIGTTQTTRVSDFPAASSRLIAKPIGIKGIWVNGAVNYFQKKL